MDEDDRIEMKWICWIVADWIVDMVEDESEKSEDIYYQ